VGRIILKPVMGERQFTKIFIFSNHFHNIFTIVIVKYLKKLSVDGGALEIARPL